MFRLPALFWAGVILFAVNAAVLLAIWFSPNLQVGMYGEESDTVVSLSKPSPFQAEIEVAKARKPRAPEKLTPVVQQEQPAEFVEAAALDIPRTTLTLPRTTPTAARQVPTAMQVAESAAEFPRMTAALMRTEQVAQSATVEVAPRRTTAQP